MKTMQAQRRDRKPYKLVLHGGEGRTLASYATLKEAEAALLMHRWGLCKTHGLCLLIALSNRALAGPAVRIIEPTNQPRKKIKYGYQTLPRSRF